MSGGEDLNVAIIGCGWAGERHARAYQQAGAQVLWLVDNNGRRADSLVISLPGARAATDYNTALDDPEVTAVSICLPHHLHAPATLAAASKGKHVLCEKPIAISLAEADSMIEAAEKAGVTLMIAENIPYSPVYREMQRLIREDAIGEPALFHMRRDMNLERSILADRSWFLSAGEAGGGVMLTGGIHDFETMRMLVGDIEIVQAIQARPRLPKTEVDDTSVALVRFRNGAAGVLVGSFISKDLATISSEVHAVRVDGDSGSIATVDGRTVLLYSEKESYMVAGQPAQQEIYVPPQDTFLLEVEHFRHCIDTGEEPLTSGRRQRRPLELVLAAYRSMESGLPVRV